MNDKKRPKIARHQASGNYTLLLIDRVKTLKGLVLVRYSSQGLRPSRTINYPIVYISPLSQYIFSFGKTPSQWVFSYIYKEGKYNAK
jgi:hypothetical protein